MPNRQQLAEAMKVSLEELDRLLNQSTHLSSLDAPVGQTDGSSNLVDLIGDESAVDPLEQVESKALQEQLPALMKTLSEQEQFILRLRYGLTGQAPQTLAEIGRQLGVSRQRIQQIEKQSINKLRRQAGSTGFTIAGSESHLIVQKTPDRPHGSTHTKSRHSSTAAPDPSLIGTKQGWPLLCGRPIGSRRYGDRSDSARTEPGYPPVPAWVESADRGKDHDGTTSS
jgi:RNA polymerase sigma factor (sigma-70 family)